jgi:2-aminoadipate transaminase
VLRMLFSVGANLTYLDLPPDGFQIDQLEYHVRVTPNLVLAYTIPSFHNPTGQSLTLEQRQAMARMLGRGRTLLVEDDTYALLRFEGERLPTLFELSGHAGVYSTSFSQTLAPGLRVGIFILPDDIAGELATTANSTYITPALIGQATVFEFIRRGSFEPHLERLTGALLERRDAMLAALEKHLPDATWSRPEGGIFILLQLTPGANAKEVVERAEGVDALAGEDFGGLPWAIRLNFAEPALDEIETGIERLAAAIEPPPEP